MEDPEHVFSNGLYLANLAVSSNILIDSWNAISKHQGDTPGTIIEHHPDYNIIAIVGSPRCDLEKETGLVPISEISDFQHLRSDTQPSFWINEAAFSLFNSLRMEFLEKVKISFEPDYSSSSRIRRTIPYIITGHRLNGCVASLFTLLLLKMLDPTRYKLPLCITFGSPLLGDTNFQQAVSCNSTWNSCFLHVVQKGDRVPILFPTSGQSPYKPFGTYLLCSESSCACFQAPDSVIQLLKHKRPDIVAGNQDYQTFNYTKVIELLEKTPLHRNDSGFLGHEADSFKAGIAAQITAAGLWQRQQQNEGIHVLIENIANHEREIVKRQPEEFDPNKGLNKTKVGMSLLVGYMELCRANGEGPGYYDRFKNAKERLENTVDKYKTYQTVYWEEVVEDAVKKAQALGSRDQPLRRRLLFAGTNYRRITEPLDIAEYYRRGEENYLTRGRSNHYELLEQWLKEYQKQNPLELAGHSKSKEVKLTEDSCFWAQVEEAIRSCRRLDRDRAGEAPKLKQFEEHVLNLIEKDALSPDVFLEKSSYMQWWREYEEILKKDEGDSDSQPSGLVDYMKKELYKNYGKEPPTD